MLSHASARTRPSRVSTRARSRRGVADLVWSAGQGEGRPDSRSNHERTEALARPHPEIDPGSGTGTPAQDGAGVGFGRPASVSARITSAPSRNSPDTRIVHAAAASVAAAPQRPAFARSQAQNAAAQKGASVYGTMLNTVVAASSQTTAAAAPP